MQPRYLITAGQNCGGARASLAREGIMQLQLLREQVIEKKIPVPPLIIVGLSLLLKNTHDIIADNPTGTPPVKTMYSPFAGSIQGREKNGSIILPWYNVSPEHDWIGLGSQFGFYPWEFIIKLPPGTFICCDEELFGALNLKVGYLESHLYELDVVGMSAEIIDLNSASRIPGNS